VAGARACHKARRRPRKKEERMSYEDLVGYQRGMMGGYAADIVGRQPYNQMGLLVDPNMPSQNSPGYGVGQAVDFGGSGAPMVYNQPVQEGPMFLRERGLFRLERQWYGFPRTEICPGETVKICGQAQVLMKIIRIFIDDSVNTNLLVCSLTYGKDDKINGDCVSATLFSPLSQDAYPQTETETIQPGCSACIVLENIGDTKLLVIVSARVAIGW
jgi:hypothetical protein